MKVIDLSHTIHPNMPVFPGTEAPRFEKANTLEKDGFKENKITMYSHTGTHLDVPAHIFKEGICLEQFRADHFYGQALLIDMTEISTGIIQKDDLEKYKPLINQIDFLILKNCWSRFCLSEDYYI